jgi:hypothetical protein
VKFYRTIFLGLALTSVSAFSADSIRIDEAGCGMLDGNRVFVEKELADVDVTNVDNLHLSCVSKSMVPNDTGIDVTFNYANTGFTCSILGGETTVWEETVTTSGVASLTCHVME